MGGAGSDEVSHSLVTSEDAGSIPAVDSWSPPHVIRICGVFFSRCSTGFPRVARFPLSLSKHTLSVSNSHLSFPAYMAYVVAHAVLIYGNNIIFFLKHAEILKYHGIESIGIASLLPLALQRFFHERSSNRKYK